MKWREARREADRCIHAYAGTIKNKYAKPNSESVVVCRHKVLRKQKNDLCPGIPRCDEVHDGRIPGWRLYYK